MALTKPTQDDLALTPTAFTNAGTAGGGGFYINNGGIKEVWGLTAAKTLVANAFVTYTINLPITIANVQSVQVCVGSGGSFYTWAKIDVNTVTSTVITLSFSNLNQAQSALNVTAYFFIRGV